MSMGVQEASAMTLLRNGIPLSLLCDLLDPEGPASSEIFTLEGGHRRPPVQ